MPRVGPKTQAASLAALLLLASTGFHDSALALGLDLEKIKNDLLKGKGSRGGRQEQIAQVEEQALSLINSGSGESLAMARQVLETSSQNGLDSARMHLYLGRIYEKAGQNDKAVMAYIEALILSEGGGIDALSAREELSALYMRQGNYDEAGGQLKKILEVSPQDIKSRGNLGICFLQLGYAAASLDEFKRVLQVDPNNFVALYNSGLAHTMEREPEKAAAAFEKAVASGEKSGEPLLPMAYLGLARAYQARGQFAFALKMTDKARELAPRSHYVYLSKAEIYEDMKDPGNALASLRKALQVNPHDKSAQQSLSRIISRQKQLIGQTQSLSQKTQ